MADASAGGTVRYCLPAVLSRVSGGNGTLAWEVSAGLVGYVGYSGSDLTGPVLAALVRLAQLSRPLDEGKDATSEASLFQAHRKMATAEVGRSVLSWLFLAFVTSMGSVWTSSTT